MKNLGRWVLVGCMMIGVAAMQVGCSDGGSDLAADEQLSTGEDGSTLDGIRSELQDAIEALKERIDGLETRPGVDEVPPGEVEPSVDCGSPLAVSIDGTSFARQAQLTIVSGDVALARVDVSGGVPPYNVHVSSQEKTFDTEGGHVFKFTKTPDGNRIALSVTDACEDRQKVTGTLTVDWPRSDDAGAAQEDDAAEDAGDNDMTHVRISADLDNPLHMFGMNIPENGAWYAVALFEGESWGDVPDGTRRQNDYAFEEHIFRKAAAFVQYSVTHECVQREKCVPDAIRINNERATITHAVLLVHGDPNGSLDMLLSIPKIVIREGSKSIVKEFPHMTMVEGEWLLKSFEVDWK